MIELEAAPPYGLVHKGPCLSSKGMTDSDNWRQSRNNMSNGRAESRSNIESRSGLDSGGEHAPFVLRIESELG